MGAVAVSDKVYQAIVEASSGNNIEFFHGYTWSAHPVACAPALAAQKIYSDESLFKRAAPLSEVFFDVFSLAGKPGVTDVRGYGMLAGVDGNPRATGVDGYTLQKRLFERGLHIKTTGDCAT